MVGIGTKILIFPDKVAFDTADGSAAPLGAVWEAGSLSVSFAPCDASGNTYEVKDKGTKEPEHPQDGQLFLKLNEPDKPYSAENTLEVYSEASGNWTVIPLDYCLVTAEGIGAEFRVWDTVTLTGTGAEQAGQWAGLDGDRIVYGVTETTLRLRADPGGRTLLRQACPQWQQCCLGEHGRHTAGRVFSGGGCEGGAPGARP